MTSPENNIFPVFDQIINRDQKEKLLKQKAKVVWFTGLSGSGKTTLGASVEKELYKKGYLTQILDGDNIRSGINKNLNFSDEDRIENIRRIAEVNKLFLNCGIITLNCFISPTEDIREMVKSIIGSENFIEIYVSTPIEVCEQRDTKGLYAKARRGEIPNFTGISSPFEVPVNPDLDIDTSVLSLETATNLILDYLMGRISLV
jgi:adenylylsulfate kinase